MYQPPSGQTSPTPQPIGNAVGVRRHQSLTYGASGGASRLARSATGGRRVGGRSGLQAAQNPQSPSPPGDDQQQQSQDEPPLSAGPWGGNGKEWSSMRRGPSDDDTVDNIQRAMGSLDLAESQQQQIEQPQQQSRHIPPPLPLAQPQPQHHLAPQYPAQNNNNSNNNANNGAAPPRFARSPGIGLATPSPPQSAQLSPGFPTPGTARARSPLGKLQLITDLSESAAKSGPASAAPYVPPIGHGSHNNPNRSMINPLRTTGLRAGGEVPKTVSSMAWNQKEKILGAREDVPPMPTFNQQYSQQRQGGQNIYGDNMSSGGLPGGFNSQLNDMSNQFGGQQQQQQRPRININIPGMNNPLMQQGRGQAPGFTNNALAQVQAQDAGFLSSPVDVPSLIAAKGYNPANFEIKPSFVSFTPVTIV
ncbi:hypothetical protein BOTBODRAFT_377598 [Botryobasidium botryosum FD-172 SS1]|uniref:Uncharacterized protein n=1 Tax=Botryobasidium botryosum (strain FD-172 SS1) TaxID=930990 RepID=A0A067N6Q1_BOTB1|nr:hypothetical protein BOTBODRAFT_377598 [Botryobasidium botryosum FD-172 SS1]